MPAFARRKLAQYVASGNVVVDVDEIATGQRTVGPQAAFDDHRPFYGRRIVVLSRPPFAQWLPWGVLLRNDMELRECRAGSVAADSAAMRAC
eukprot:gene6141-28781_t